MLGTSAYNLYAEEGVREELFNAMKANGKVVDWNGLGKRRDGTSFWVSMNVQYIYDNEGKIIGAQGVVRDISERKHLEEDLRLGEEKFRKAFDISADSININRLNDGNYAFVNRGFLQITGFTEEETSLELNIWLDP